MSTVAIAPVSDLTPTFVAAIPWRLIDTATPWRDLSTVISRFRATLADPEITALIRMNLATVNLVLANRNLADIRGRLISQTDEAANSSRATVNDVLKRYENSWIIPCDEFVNGMLFLIPDGVVHVEFRLPTGSRTVVMHV